MISFNFGFQSFVGSSVLVVIVWQLDLQLPVQSVSITTTGLLQAKVALFKGYCVIDQ